MLDVKNQENYDLKLVERRGFPGWKIDLYSHFKRLGIVKPCNRMHMINLRDYYQWKEGFSVDKLDHIVRDLQRIRFFNRFDRDTLFQMVKMADLRVV